MKTKSVYTSYDQYFFESSVFLKYKGLFNEVSTFINIYLVSKHF